jgi:hypothetical protein
LKKIYSKLMVGTGRFFDTKIGRKITAYKLIVGALTDGHFTIPIKFGFMFDKELLEKDDVVKTKLDYIKEFYESAKKLFPNVLIRIAADGLFASIELLKWCIDNNIQAILRMHSNRKVIFNGQKIKISEIECLKPVGRQMARTIKIIWHGLTLFLTAEKRINKKGEESIVYLIATYQAIPKKYVKDYKKRWPIEKLYRTDKQFLGIEECFSTQLEIQERHIASVLLAYSIAQLEMKISRLKNPEEAIRLLKNKSFKFLNKRFTSLDEIFGEVHA